MQSKRLTLAFLLATTVALGGCKDEVLDFRNADISNGKIYADKANEPFTGKVTNIPLTQLSTPRFGDLQSLMMQSAQDGESRRNWSYAAMLGWGNIPCDVAVDKGVPHGKTVCKVPNSETIAAAIPYSSGQVDGTVFIYAPAKTDGAVIEADYKSDTFDGPIKVYSPKTGKLLNISHWKNGVIHGQQEVYSENTGNLRLKIAFVDGKADGEAVENYDSGEPRFKTVYQNGVIVKNEDFRAPFDMDGCMREAEEEYRSRMGENAVVTWYKTEDWSRSCKIKRDVR